MEDASPNPVPLPDPRAVSDAEWRRLLSEAGLSDAAGLPPDVIATPNEVAGAPRNLGAAGIGYPGHGQLVYVSVCKRFSGKGAVSRCEGWKR